MPDIMPNFVGFVVIYSYCCVYDIKTQTVPEEQFVYKGEPWETKLNLPITPTTDELCRIWVNLVAKWQNGLPDQLKDVSTIDLRFEHPDFKETKIDVMKVQHEELETNKSIHICFSPCLTQMDKDTFTLHASTKNILQENAINLKVNSEKSFLSYIEHCSDKAVVVESPWLKLFIGTNCFWVLVAVVSIIIICCFIKKCSRPRSSHPFQPPEGGGQSSEGESTALTDIVTKGSDNRPRGGPGTKKNKKNE